MCDAHLDAIISRGFRTDVLRSLAQLYIDHGFLSEEEADTFLLIYQSLVKKMTTVSDQMFRDPQSEMGNLIHFTTNLDLNNMVETFTHAVSTRAYKWIENEFNENKQVFAAIIGPAGTGKSYLLTGLIELAKSKGLVVSKLAPSGVAAHLIGGTTIHNFFSLDVILVLRMAQYR